MEGFLLTLLGTAGQGPVVPRRMELKARPFEDGLLHLRGAPSTDPSWLSSVGAAWRAAQRLTGRTQADGDLVIHTNATLQGGSAGFPVGLLALAALLDEPLPPHFATGAVLDDRGFLAGGGAALAKARAAAEVAHQLGVAQPRFLAPPVEEPPVVGGVDVALATDLGTALARLAPKAYEKIASRHRELRALPGPEKRRAFAVVEGWKDRSAASADPFGIPVYHAETTPSRGAWADLGENGLILWRAPLDPERPLPQQLGRLHALAKQHSHL